MLTVQRHDAIVRQIAEHGSASVLDLAGRLGVSLATIRRDLSMLERTGRLVRVHGGAVLGERQERSFVEEQNTDRTERDAVAEAAAALIEDGDIVVLDIGITTHLVARRLVGRPVTVVTSSLAVADVLATDEECELVLLGGVVRRNYRSLVGPLTEAALGQLHADKLFLGTSGLLPDGSVLDTTAVEVPIKRAMIACADRVILLCDATKFPGSGLTRVCGPERLDTLVTNANADPGTLDLLRATGVEVITA